jgi:monoamine oxidase
LSRRIGIVGGGLAGLHAAALLERQGCEPVLLEGRDRLGGRLLAVRADEREADTAAFDLGATWYWPDLQPAFADWIASLGLRTFAQPVRGDLVFEGRPGQLQRVPDFDGSPVAMRVAGGMATLADAARSALRATALHLGHRVEAMSVGARGVTVAATTPGGGCASFDVDRVLLAVPPRLARATIRFDAPLPEAVAADWDATDTWMAPHAKYVAVYDAPFWREQGLSGGARSRTGPLAEVHDASPPQGPGALFGFVGVPAAQRRRVPAGALRELCRAQLGRLFGARAAEPLRDWLQDWAAEPLTATEADLASAGGHGHGALQVTDGPWAGSIFGIASEWSTAFPGYAAGAVDAARGGVARMLGT